MAKMILKKLWSNLADFKTYHLAVVAKTANIPTESTQKKTSGSQNESAEICPYLTKVQNQFCGGRKFL